MKSAKAIEGIKRRSNTYRQKHPERVKESNDRWRKSEKGLDYKNGFIFRVKRAEYMRNYRTENRDKILIWERRSKGK